MKYAWLFIGVGVVIALIRILVIDFYYVHGEKIISEKLLFIGFGIQFIFLGAGVALWHRKKQKIKPVKGIGRYS